MAVPYAEVIGDPIAHSKSPLIHNFWLEKVGIEGDYRAVRVTVDELQRYFEDRRKDPHWRGCSVTIPHKKSVISLLDVVADHGIGAVNCVIPRQGELEGRNTDAGGIGEVVPDRIDTSRPVAIIGAGGAARAVVAMLDVYAVFQFNVIVRNWQCGEALLNEFGMEGGTFSFDQDETDLALKGAAAVINASPLGMTGYPSMPESVLTGICGVSRGGFALDLVYAPLRTEFLERGAAAGLVTMDGLSVLIAQAAEAFRLFFGVKVPREHDAELRELLTR